MENRVRLFLIVVLSCLLVGCGSFGQRHPGAEDSEGWSRSDTGLEKDVYRDFQDHLGALISGDVELAYSFLSYHYRLTHQILTVEEFAEAYNEGKAVIQADAANITIRMVTIDKGARMATVLFQRSNGTYLIELVLEAEGNRAMKWKVNRKPWRATS
jgi:hypothetical protein